MLYMLREDPNGVILHAKERLRLRPDEPASVLFLAGAYQEVKDYSSAIPLFRRIVDFAPDFDAHEHIELAMAEGYFHTHQFEDCLDLVRSSTHDWFERDDVRSLEARYWYARSCLETGQIHTATSMFQEIALHDREFRDVADRLRSEVSTPSPATSRPPRPVSASTSARSNTPTAQKTVRKAEPKHRTDMQTCAQCGSESEAGVIWCWRCRGDLRESSSAAGSRGRRVRTADDDFFDRLSVRPSNPHQNEIDDLLLQALTLECEADEHDTGKLRRVTQLRENAAALGSSEAHVELGSQFSQGYLFPEDMQRALHHYKQAARLGNFEGYSGMAHVLSLDGQADEAEACWERMFALAPKPGTPERQIFTIALTSCVSFFMRRPSVPPPHRSFLVRCRQELTAHLEARIQESRVSGTSSFTDHLQEELAWVRSNLGR